MVRSAYIHIPFCSHICSYCDFCKMLYYEKYVDNYLTALEQEINDRYQGELLDTVYIGGGTPSCLTEKELERLFILLERLKKNDNYEYTIEANFDSITFSKLDLCKKYGINRISFGLETTQPWLLEKMGRELSTTFVRRIISYCKKIGISNINVDLMYAFPKETLQEVSRDLDFILSLDVPHISTYSLILEEHTRLYFDKVKEIDEETDAMMYQEIINKLKGYRHYEISNFGKEGYESRHNQCYWRNLEYYGFGLGASGYYKDRRYTNTRSIQKYLLGNYELSFEKLDLYDKIYYEVILNLRMQQGISKREFFKKYSHELLEFYDYHSLLIDGVLVETDEFLFIPEKYWYISNEILIRLLEECKYE